MSRWIECQRETEREIKTDSRGFACATGRLGWSAAKTGMIMRGTGLGKELESSFVHAQLAAPVRHVGKEPGVSLGAVDLGRGLEPGEGSKTRAWDTEGWKQRQMRRISRGARAGRRESQKTGTDHGRVCCPDPGAETARAPPLPGPWSRPSWRCRCRRRSEPSSR